MRGLSAPELTPDGIIRHVLALPPFQRQSAAKNYEGIRVSWRLRLFSADAYAGKAYVNGDMTDFSSTVRCEVDLDRYPEFKVMEPGRPFWVEGRVSTVDHALRLISLTGCSFRY